MHMGVQFLLGVCTFGYKVKLIIRMLDGNAKNDMGQDTILEIFDEVLWIANVEDVVMEDNRRFNSKSEIEIIL